MKEITSIQTPFPQKFGIPRQSLLIEEAWGKMIFTKDDFFSEAFRGIENFSHLWLIFRFSGVSESDQPALVYPPRFEGKLKLGVFATRTPHRPNRIGLSVVKFDRIEIQGSQIILWVKGVDLMDGTPILDIKPYLPYCDEIREAKADLFELAPTFKKVIWECPDDQVDEQMKVLIEKVIGLDPRPGHERKANFSYGVSVGGFNVRFHLVEEDFVITELTRE